MNLRPQGIAWFRRYFGEPTGPIHISRFYPPWKSWTKHAVWAFEIPPREINDGNIPYIFLVYQLSEGQQEFACLRIPSRFLLSWQRQLYIRPDNGNISLFLSAEAGELLHDKRGTGRIDFRQFAW